MALPRRNSIAGFLFLVGLTLLAGCATDGVGGRAHIVTLPIDANGLVTGTGFEAADVKVACGAIQRGLESVLGLARGGRAVQIVVEPVVNDTRYTVQTGVFDRSVREQLAAWAPRRWHFLEKPPAAGQVDFYLSGRLQHLRSLVPSENVTLLYSFQLMDANTSEIIWEGTAELKNRSFQESDQPGAEPGGNQDEPKF